jgi:hypothetical protein
MIAWPKLLRSFAALVLTRAGLDELGVDFFVFEAGFVGVGGECGFGGLEELFVVAVGEVGLVVRAAGLVAEGCALGYDA